MGRFLKYCKSEPALDELTSKICRETGWKSYKAKWNLYQATLCGVTEQQYMEHYGWDLTNQELKELSRVLKDRRKLWRENKKFYLDVVCKHTGWSEEEAKEKLDQAKKKGVSASTYIARAMWANPQELEKKSNKKKKAAGSTGANKGSKKKKEDKQLGYVKNIQKATGWSEGKTRFELLKSYVYCGTTYEDFYMYHFYDLSMEERKKYATYYPFSKLRLKSNNLAKRAPLSDKGLFNETFKDYLHRAWFVNKDISYEEFLEKIKGLEYLIIKPTRNEKGAGIRKVACNVSEEENKKLYKEIMEMDRCVVEEYLVQNKEIMEFCDTSVNTVRVVTLQKDGECHFLYAVFRMGRGAVVDNFHAGGIVAAVNLDTGIVETNAVDLDSNFFAENPYSGKKIKGFQIPYWKEIKETCEKISGKVDGIDLIGWDFAVLKDGVELIEGNTTPSYALAQEPYLEDGIGIADQIITPYL